MSLSFALLFLLSSTDAQRFVVEGVQVTPFIQDTKGCEIVLELKEYPSIMKQADWAIMRLSNPLTDDIEYYQRRYENSSYKMAKTLSANLVFQEVQEFKTGKLPLNIEEQNILLSSQHSDKETVIYRPIFYVCDHGK